MGTDRGTELDETPAAAVYCARHPDVESYLRCGRCDTPVCPGCLVQTDMGARCPQCVLSGSPSGRAAGLTAQQLAMGLAAAVSAGIVTGAIWGAVPGAGIPGGTLGVLFGLAIGWAVSEAVIRATHGGAGVPLQVFAGAGVLIAYVVYLQLSPGNAIVPGRVLATSIGAAFAVMRLRR